MIKRQEAIILSMTNRNASVGLLNARAASALPPDREPPFRRNRLVKQYQDMARMMKKPGSKPAPPR